MEEDVKKALAQFDIYSDNYSFCIPGYSIKISRIATDAWCNDSDNPYIKILNSVLICINNLMSSKLVHIACNVPVHIIDVKEYKYLFNIEIEKDNVSAEIVVAKKNRKNRNEK